MLFASTTHAASPPADGEPPMEFNVVGSAPARTTILAYHDDVTDWVLGQTSRETINGIVTAETTFDALARPVVRKAFGKVVETLAYRNDGTLLSTSDGRDSATFDTTVTYGVFKRGLPSSITHADGSTVSADIDDFGQIRSVTSETGARTCYAYDAMGRITAITYPSETHAGVCDASAWNTTHRSFARIEVAERGLAAGHWRELVATGNARRYTWYDALWRPVLTHEFDAADATASSRMRVTRYDALGKAAFQSYPVRDIADVAKPLAGTHTRHDALGRVTRVEQDSELGPLVTSTIYLGNTTGPYIHVTDARGHITRTWFQVFDAPDDQSRPIAIVPHDQSATEIVRDVFGKPTSITRRNSTGSVSATRQYVYNAEQRLCRTIEPETGNTFQGYDPAGNLAWSAAGVDTQAPGCASWASVTDRRADRAYDARNRLVSLKFPDGLGDTTYAYAADGLPTTMTVDNGHGNVVSTTYAYNNRRLLTNEAMAWNAIRWTVGYHYDRNGHLAQHDYPGPLSVAYAPNALGQPTRAGTFATNVDWHPNGALHALTYGNGVVHRIDQNTRQMPDRSRHHHGATAILDDSYDYDQNGNVVAISDGATAGATDRDMVYDSLDRLTTMKSPMLGGSGAIYYGYDALDNITSVSSPNRSQRYCYEDGTNRLTTVRAGALVPCGNGAAAMVALAYDVQGNLRTKNNVNFQFGFDNRLRSTTGGVASSYVYDASGRRVRDYTTGSRYSLYTQGGQLAYTSDARKQEAANYVYLGGRLIATRTSVGSTNATVRYQHTDALGTPVAVTDAGGAVIERNRYEPYGRVLDQAAQDRVGFTGHVEDKATGLTYMQQRYYDSLGTFPSVRPDGRRHDIGLELLPLLLRRQQSVQVQGSGRARDRNGLGRD